MEKKCPFYSHFYKAKAFKLKLVKQSGKIQAMNKSTTTAFFGT